MTISGHKPYYRGFSCVCAHCGVLLFDVRTAARLRALDDVDEVKRAAVERRFSSDPELAKRLTEEDPREVISTYKFADKFNDFLMNPKARPDLQKPEAQKFLNTLKGYHNTKTDPMMPWLMREWKKGRIRHHPTEPGGTRIQFNGGPEYEHDGESFHTLTPDQLNHWADWYGSDHPSRQGQDIMQMKAPELHQTIKDWDTDMRDKAGGQAQQRGNVVHSYPDGWTVQQLTEPNQLEDEGEKMGHCVGSYGPSVQRGESLIYSLRDHQNEPHATWEVTPKWHEGEDGKLYSNPDGTDETDQHYFRTTPSPKEGTMEQIQGKGNKPPIADYQKRIKDYFEQTMPDSEDRPKWDDQHYDNLDEFMDQEGHLGYIPYHPGEYGLEKPKTTFDWPSLLEKQLGWGEYEPDALVKKAVEHGQFSQMSAQAAKDISQRREERKDELEQEYEKYEEPEFSSRYYESDPEPDPSDSLYNEGDYDSNGYNKAWEEWESREMAARDAHMRAWIHEREQQGYEEGEYLDGMETEIAAQKRRENESINTPQLANLKDLPIRYYSALQNERAPHTHYSTREPCYCTFSKVTPELHQSGIPVCEVCGDPLDHGQCKRCDWGQWSNAMGDGDQNPTDPTREFHPSIQAKMTKWDWDTEAEQYKDWPDKPAELTGQSAEYGHPLGDVFWGAGGCAHLALAFKNVYPQMKLAAGWYDDRGRKGLSHVVAYDPETNRAFDSYGVHDNPKDAVWNQGNTYDMDADPHDIAQHMEIPWDDNDRSWESPEVNEGGEFIEDHFLPGEWQTRE